MIQQTAMDLLFAKFKALSESSRFAGDDKTANLIDFLCEREDVAKQHEKKQIIDAWRNGDNDSMYSPKELDQHAEEYYKETYGK